MLVVWVDSKESREASNRLPALKPATGCLPCRHSPHGYQPASPALPCFDPWAQPHSASVSLPGSWSSSSVGVANPPLSPVLLTSPRTYEILAINHYSDVLVLGNSVDQHKHQPLNDYGQFIFLFTDLAGLCVMQADGLLWSWTRTT